MGLRADVALYRYALSNPILNSDPDGRQALGPILPGTPWSPPPLACALNVFTEGTKIGRGQGFRYAHCISSCKIVNRCGGSPALAEGLGLLNEASQTTQCLVDILVTGSASGNSKCDSASAEQDFLDNRFGALCPTTKTCDERCKPLLGLDKTPNLFGPFSGATRRDLPRIFMGQ